MSNQVRPQMKRSRFDSVVSQASESLISISELSCSDAKVHTCHSLFS